MPPSRASAYYRNLDNWPHSWMELDKDLPPGQQLVVCPRPFLNHLASSSLSPKTIRRQADHLWLMGGEIIRDLNYDPSLRKMAAKRLLHNVIYEDGGPLIHDGSEDEQRSFDSTCRKLHRCLSNLTAEARQLPTNFPDVPQFKGLIVFHSGSRTDDEQPGKYYPEGRVVAK